jgi:hypothetical protein
LSALTDSNGFWVVNLGNARTTSLNSFFSFTMGADTMTVQADGAADGTASETVTVPAVSGTQVASLTLGGGTASMSLISGWNLISLPIAPAANYVAQNLLNDINIQGGTATEADRWKNGSWEGHVNGYPFNNFSVLTGYGYFVRTNSASTFVVHSGGGPLSMVKPASSTSITLNVGWNLIALPYDAANDYTASSLLQEIKNQGGSPVEIDQWTAGTWQAFIFGYPFNNFTVVKGLGYFVKVNTASTWTPH